VEGPSVDAYAPAQIAARIHDSGIAKARLPALQVLPLAVRIAAAKCALPFAEAFFRGVLCNALVCLAVWLCFGARTATGKAVAIAFPITAFVALGFEHSIANMYFIPMGLLLEGRAELAASLQASGAGLEALEGVGCLRNLVPVPLGNIVGGTGLVAGVYWLVYLRPTRR
jgi:formate/nitrite transporter